MIIKEAPNIARSSSSFRGISLSLNSGNSSTALWVGVGKVTKKQYYLGFGTGKFWHLRIRVGPFCAAINPGRTGLSERISQLAPVLLIPLFALKCYCFAGWSLEVKGTPLFVYDLLPGTRCWICAGDPERCVIMMITCTRTGSNLRGKQLSPRVPVNLSTKQSVIKPTRRGGAVPYGDDT